MAIASPCQKRKANELRQQIQQIGEASDLTELEYRKSPYPGKISSLTGSVEVSEPATGRLAMRPASIWW